MTLLSRAAIAAAVVLGTTFTLGIFKAPTVETEIEIEAPVDRVWHLLADTEHYAEWNPFIRSLEGELQVGATLAVSIQLAGKSAMNFTPKVLVASPNQELRWVGKLGLRGVFDGEHHFRLEETAGGGTRFIHGEQFRGVLAYILFPLIGSDTKAGFVAMNQALKSEAEALS
ncbi:MAG: SRPBCC domain-containing protein [Thalassovita sp.]